ncbi:MAG: BatA domain-containing protein [Verrucomicrobia bacterium]|nr:BatA domain-containing protein [Cytophagales bacterium]
MWQLANPVYGWALLALAIPILIHLQNRHQSKVRILGSIRWLKEVQQTRSHFRYIRQWLLLSVRMLLIAVIVLLLAGLFKNESAESNNTRKTLILIHPEAGSISEYKQLAEKWQNDSIQVCWLMPDFPVVSELPQVESNPAVWSLVAEADQRFDADSIHLIAPDRTDYFAGVPPEIKAAFSYELTENQQDTTRLLQAMLVNQIPESLWFLSENTYTGFIQENSSNSFPKTEWLKDKNTILVKDKKLDYEVPVKTADTLIITGIAKNHPQAWQTFRQAVQAVADFHRVPLRFSETSGQANWLVDFDETKKNGKKGTLVWKYIPESGSGWIEPVKENSLLIRKELSTGQVLEGGLLQELRKYVLAFKYKNSPQPEIDFRKTDIAGLVTRKKSTVSTLANQSTDNQRFWLGIIALTLLAIERFLPKKSIA